MDAKKVVTDFVEGGIYGVAATELVQHFVEDVGDFPMPWTMVVTGGVVAINGLRESITGR